MAISGANFGNAGINNTQELLDSGSSLSILKRAFQSASVRQGGALRTMISQVSDLSDELEAFMKVAQNSRLVQSGSGTVAASSIGIDLGLSTSDAYSSLVGSAEINEVTTAYDTTTPSWTGTKIGGGSVTLSTSQVTISGVYTGSEDDTLTFEATHTATAGGAQPLGFRIYDGSGAQIDAVNWTPYDPVGTEISSSVTGLTFSLGAGKTRRFDTFNLGVTTGIQNDVDEDDLLTDAAFEDSFSISAGSFEINGETIAVDPATDTLADVLDAINASGAGVTASLEDDQISIVADDFGSDPITIANDTTGLIAALKLDDGAAVTGSVDEAEVAMDTVGAFSGVSTGSFTVNGQSIDIDPATDSLEDILDAINGADAGAVASFSGGKVRIQSIDGGSLTLGGDSSGFLSSVGISEGTVDPVEGTGGQRGSRQAARRLADAFVSLAEKLNAVFGENAELDEVARLDRIGMQSKIRASIGGAMAERDQTAEDNVLGLVFNLDGEGEDALVMRRSDIKDLEKAMVSDPRDIDRLLFGSNQSTGMIERMAEGAEAAIEELQDTLKGVGSLMSTYA